MAAFRRVAGGGLRHASCGNPSCPSGQPFSDQRPMPVPLDYVVAALVTLLVVVDPIGLTPAFLGITVDLPRLARRQVAIRACLVAFAILTGAALAGDWLLRTLSISLPAFRIAGGLLLFSIASEMVFGVRIARQSEAAEQAVEEHVRNIAAFPLAIPLMADRKSTRLNSSHDQISYAVFCLKKKK